jgi:hypothetical protein
MKQAAEWVIVRCAYEPCRRPIRMRRNTAERRNAKHHFCCRDHHYKWRLDKKRVTEKRKPPLATQHPEYVNWGEGPRYQKPQIQDTKHAGHTTCLSCGAEFWSPDKTRVRRCDRCKANPFYRDDYMANISLRR